MENQLPGNRSRSTRRQAESHPRHHLPIGPALANYGESVGKYHPLPASIKLLKHMIREDKSELQRQPETMLDEKD
ncbi:MULTISPECIES: hypothetical protein [unclassified Akkermansia]|jgi:hypothetical protein|uniref:hypothetical protein n=1 Tax=unclassified Akkermansia TaxID=2608915 RepID=UPI000AE0C6BE|nr:hypothetical protein [Akkermansia sp. KLE1798]